MLGSWMALAWKSTVVLSAAWLLVRLLRGRPASVRHLVWSGALAAVLLLPAFSAWLPSLRVPVPVPALRFEAAAVAGLAGATETPVARAAGGGAPVPAGPLTDWGRLWMLAWGAGTAVILLGMARAWLSLERVKRAANPLDVPEQAELAQGLGIGRAVRVLEAGAGSMPMTCGLVSPVVFLPAEAREWTEERRRLVLLHELAHVRRGDAAAQLMARCAVALCWWNPLVWKAWREFLRERERAADDLVLQSGARASAYAGHLLEIARSMAPAEAVGLAAVAMARRSQLEDRLAAILDERVRRGAAGRAGVAAAAVAVLLASVPLASVRAQEAAPDAAANVEATILAARSQKNFEMLDRAAEAAARGLRYDAARKLLDASLAVRGENNGQSSPEYGEGLLRLGRLENMRGNRAAADALFGQAAEVLKNHPRAASAWIWMGTSALLNKDYAKALGLFERARAMDPNGARVVMWMAVTRMHEKNAAEADALFKSAMALVDAKSADAVTVEMVYANFLKAQGRGEEAAEMERRAREAQRSLAVKPAATGAGVKRIGGDVKAPKLIEKVEPKYTEEARAAKLAGTVVLYAEVWPDGKAHNVQVTQGLGLGLEQKAAEAVSQWRFEPGTENGQAVPVSATIEINFKLL